MSLVECKQIALQSIDEVFNKGNFPVVDKFVIYDFGNHARRENLSGIMKLEGGALFEW